jgi:hypothetical protein
VVVLVARHLLLRWFGKVQPTFTTTQPGLSKVWLKGSSTISGFLRLADSFGGGPLGALGSSHSFTLSPSAQSPSRVTLKLDPKTGILTHADMSHLSRQMRWGGRGGNESSGGCIRR